MQSCRLSQSFVGIQQRCNLPTLQWSAVGVARHGKCNSCRCLHSQCYTDWELATALSMIIIR